MRSNPRNCQLRGFFFIKTADQSHNPKPTGAALQQPGDEYIFLPAFLFIPFRAVKSRESIRNLRSQVIPDQSRRAESGIFNCEEFTHHNQPPYLLLFCRSCTIVLYGILGTFSTAPHCPYFYLRNRRGQDPELYDLSPWMCPKVTMLPMNIPTLWRK